MVVNNRIMNLLANQGDLKTNEISLRISSEAIINLLSEINPDALTFFYFLSMLPTGSLPAHLNQMWGVGYGKCTEILKSFGMLEPSTDRIILTPFMMNYADQTIDRASKELFNKKIAEFYEEMLRNFYNEDVTQRNSISIREELNNNIRLCIQRLLGSKQPSPSSPHIKSPVRNFSSQVQKLSLNIEKKGHDFTDFTDLISPYYRIEPLSGAKHMLEGVSPKVNLVGRVRLGIGELEICEESLTDSEFHQSFTTKSEGSPQSGLPFPFLQQEISRIEEEDSGNDSVSVESDEISLEEEFTLK